jgi:hypothetical protein
MYFGCDIFMEILCRENKILLVCVREREILYKEQHGNRNKKE